MANKEAAIAVAEHAEKLLETAVKASKDGVSLKDLLPNWDEMDKEQRELVGLEFRDRIQKKSDTIELAGQNEAGEDVYKVR